jgi:hypothetical protein
MLDERLRLAREVPDAYFYIEQAVDLHFLLYSKTSQFKGYTIEGAITMMFRAFLAVPEMRVSRFSFGSLGLGRE